ncbi:hypothetical protein LF1_03610 [Rubripirellula obstinata]|uniref:Protein containing DUF1549 n=1 Tax=Rubripirellula obstinata TaxID=406547 RepID=A0A5B1CCA9_9BACT|nr:DUF1553 domain-containing protein [Rubripirellula obstinata]KAA1257871.1 hypothetical protein LF1_03610 [Rubripirellula obstinata]
MSDRKNDSDNNASGSRIAEMFDKGFSSVSPSEQFKDQLKERLQNQFAESQLAIENNVQRPTAKSPRSWRRLSLGFVAAAAAVLVMVLWPARPVYSFDAMRDRLSDEAFLRVNFQEQGQSFVGWVSSDGKFAAVESSSSVAWATKGTHATFDRETKQSKSLVDAKSVRSSIQVRALRVLDALRGDGNSGLRVVNESWQTVDTSGGADGILKVRFAEADVEQAAFDASFGIDSSTGLPVWIDLDDSGDVRDSNSDSRLPLAYPKKGPTQLSSLGVPPDWASMMSDRSTKPATDSLSMGKSDAKDDNEEQDASSVAVSRQPEVSLPLDAGPEPFVATEPTRTWPQPLPVQVPSDAKAMATRVDDRLKSVWDDEGLQPGPAADAPTLFRRMHLDLTGRIPHVAEIRQGIDGGKFDVASLLSRMLDSPDFDSNMASVWVRWLLPPDVELEQFGGKPALQAWLAEQFEARVSYDQIVRDLLTAQGRVGDPGPVLFTTALEMKPDHLAKQTARTFLGTRIDCAMCHDHPYDTWTQTDFWGYAALFARISRPQGKMNAMSSVLQVRDVGDGEVTFPDTEIVVQPRLLGGGRLNEQPESNQRRRQLADWITDPTNRQFARATVNLVWSHFFGAGLVHPRDDFGTHNPALSPELLEELAAFFIESNYDVRSLVSAIVLSDAYQRSSQTESDTDRPMFDSMPIRWLTAEQLYDCLLVASGGLGESSVALDPALGLNRVNNTARDSFVEKFGSTSDSVLEYQAGIPQALSLMNGTLSNLSAGEDSSRLLRGLRAPFFSDADRIETVFLSLVGRPPSQRESAAVNRILQDVRKDETSEVLSDLVWALLNSAEFATNH